MYETSTPEPMVRNATMPPNAGAFCRPVPPHAGFFPARGFAQRRDGARLHYA